MTASLAVVAGGKGTRLQSRFGDIPKCLVPVAGKPVLQYLLDVAQRARVRRVYVLTGHLSELVESYVALQASVMGLDVRCIAEPEPLGTAGAFRLLESGWSDPTECLIVMYGDLVCNVDLDRLIRFHGHHDGIVTVCAHPNDHPFDSDLLEVDSDDRVTRVRRKPHADEAMLGNLVSAGIYVVDRAILDHIPSVRADWMHDVFTVDFLKRERAYAYRTSEFIKDMGTPERWTEVERSVRSGRYAAATYRRPRPCAFLDRDGTINRDVGLCHRPEDFELLEGSAEAIARLNQSTYLAIVLTNQSVIARGLCSLDELRDIHRVMETLLGRKRAYVDGLFFCPHHPDGGYPEEVSQLKIACDCRKPGVALFERARLAFNIDLSRSVMVGDSTADIQAGVNAGVATALLETGRAGKDGQYAARPDSVYPDLLAAVTDLLAKGES